MWGPRSDSTPSLPTAPKAAPEEAVTAKKAELYNPFAESKAAPSSASASSKEAVPRSQTPVVQKKRTEPSSSNSSSNNRDKTNDKKTIEDGEEQFASVTEAKVALSSKRQLSCYNCGATGHLGDDCHQPKWAQSQSSSGVKRFRYR
ncbi:MAG: CCHC-type zinc finger protein [archaeon]|nr:CCHC-type zinc finger protein [archaeon]